MTTKLKRHILQPLGEYFHGPSNRITYCGRVIPLQRRIKFVDNWDDSTCLTCIKLAEEDESSWKHPSHRG